MKVILVGGGTTLYFVCRKFISRGYEVVIVSRSHSECTRLAREFKASVICGDGSDARTLREAGAMDADAVLAITPHDQDNLIVCQLAALQFDVPRVVALTNDPENASLFTALGITAFSTADIIGSLIEQRATLEHVINLLPVGEGQVNVTEIFLDEQSPLAGKELRNVELPENALIAVVIRDEQAIVPRGSSRVQSGDRLILITRPDNHGATLKRITGENP